MSGADPSIERRGMRAWLGDSSTLLLFQVAATGMATVTFLLIARSLGTSKFGAFAGVLGLAQATSLFLDAGLGTFLLREFTSGTGRASPGGLLRSALRLEVRMIGAAITLFALVTLAVTQKGQLAAAAGLLVAYVGALTLCISIEALYRSRRYVRRVGVALTIDKVTALAIIGVAAASGSTGIVLVAGALFSSAMARLTFDYVFLRRTVKGDADSAPVVRPTALLRRSLPFAATAFVIADIPRLDVTIVAAVSVQAAAYFAVGDRLVLGPLTFSAVFSQALFPHIGRGTISASRALAVQFGVGLLGMLGVILVTGPLAGIAFHHPPAEAITTVRIMSAAIPFSFLASGLLVRAYTYKLESTIWISTLIASALGLAAVLIGVAIDPLRGVAIGYVSRSAFICAALAIVIARAQRSSTVTAGLPNPRPQEQS
jgi:O-antigen/teichoic acid export membrane protein